MKILFGTPILGANDSDGTIISNTAGNFYYGVEYGTEYGSNLASFDEFRVMDGCGRYLPIDIGNLDKLQRALEIVKEIVALRKALEAEAEASTFKLQFVTESIALPSGEICL